MTSIFEEVKEALHPRLGLVIQELLPSGKISGKEYPCASLQGGAGSSCVTNVETGRGSDFATGESWGDVIGLWAKIRGIRQGEAARELADKYGIHLDGMPQVPRPVVSTAPPPTFTPILPVPPSAPKPSSVHPQHGQASALWRYADAQGRTLAYTGPLPAGRLQGSPASVLRQQRQRPALALESHAAAAPSLCMDCTNWRPGLKPLFFWWKEKRQRTRPRPVSRIMLL